MVFEEFASFTRRVMELLDDDDLADVQGLLLARPDAGKVIPKSGRVAEIARGGQRTRQARRGADDLLLGGCPRPDSDAGHLREEREGRFERGRIETTADVD
jgi:hypothetical protein